MSQTYNHCNQLACKMAVNKTIYCYVCTLDKKMAHMPYMHSHYTLVSIDKNQVAILTHSEHYIVILDNYKEVNSNKTLNTKLLYIYFITVLTSETSNSLQRYELLLQKCEPLTISAYVTINTQWEL